MHKNKIIITFLIFETPNIIDILCALKQNSKMKLNIYIYVFMCVININTQKHMNYLRMFR